MIYPTQPSTPLSHWTGSGASQRRGETGTQSIWHDKNMNMLYSSRDPLRCQVTVSILWRRLIVSCVVVQHCLLQAVYAGRQHRFAEALPVPACDVFDVTEEATEELREDHRGQGCGLKEWVYFTFGASVTTSLSIAR
jgi:hypothetical protein